MHHTYEKGTDVTYPEHSPKTPRNEAGFFARLRAFLVRQGSGAPSHRPAAMGCVTVVAIGLLLSAAPAFAAPGPPYWPPNSPLTVSNIHATRASAEGGVETHESETTVRVEYATNPSGPWTLSQSVTCAAGSIAENGCGAGTQFTHLAPLTTYYVRAFARNAFGEAPEQTRRFTTTALEAPEIGGQGCGGDFIIGGGFCATIRITSAVLYTRIETNGAETGYQFESAESEGGPFTPVPGSSGTITVAEDVAQPEAHLTGLTPETTYYVRAKATNEKGTTPSEIGHFITGSAHPQADVGAISNVTATSAHLEGFVHPNTYETHWHFEYATVEAGPWSPVPGGSGTIPLAEADEASHTVQADLTGLSPARTYYVRLFAENGHEPAATSKAESFETAGPPLVTTFAVHALRGETLRALGSVEPHGYDTHYHFEYVTEKQFKEEGGFAKATSTPELDAGSGNGKMVIGKIEIGNEEFLGEFVYPTESVGQDLSELQPGTTYRYRLLATSTAPGKPVIPGEEQTLTVPTPAPVEPPAACPNEQFRTGLSTHLPDCRAYEQVTPRYKEGALEPYTYLGGSGATLVGEDGEHLMLTAPNTFWGSGQGPYFFSRTPAGWQMAAATSQPEAGFGTYGPQIVSPDLTGVGVFAGSTSSASFRTETEFKVGPPGGPYTAVASVPDSQVNRNKRDGWVAASEDFSKLILKLEDHTLLGHFTGTTSGSDLYEYSAHAELRQVNVGIGACGANIAKGRESGKRTELVSSRNAVSADGSRVFFQASPGSSCPSPEEVKHGGPNNHLYMREGGAEKTLDIGEYQFVEANPAGSELLISHNGELFRYDTETQATEPAPVGESLSAPGRYSYTIEEVSRAEFGTKENLLPQLIRHDHLENTVECISCASPFDPEPKLGLIGSAAVSYGTVDGMPDAGAFALEGNVGVTVEAHASANGDYAFFTTPAALVPQDQNGEVPPEASDLHRERPEGSPSTDVYEWRRDGLDGCTHLQGCLALITPGTDGYLVALIGTDASGRDVFFTTHSSLLPSDNDTAGDIYVARIGGGYPTPTRPVECEGDACSTPFAAPSDLTPSSSTFQGAGNLLGATLPVVKPKPKPKAKSRCKAKAKKKCKAKPKKKRKKAKKASNKRTAKR